MAVRHRAALRFVYEEEQMKRRVELLAPAGNPEGFYGAVCAGADAVYLGGSRYGARAYADNFTEEELLECIRYAHIWGRRVYLTVNTLIKDPEMEELFPYLRPLYEAGLDGVIVQDIGVFSFIRKHFPGLELHVSTQAAVASRYGAEIFRKMGAVRVVPARELSLGEIRELKESTGLQVETFIHGAMCYCYSGQCLFSSILGGRSGNRGRCAQPCRLPYRVERGMRVTEECYPLSLKDMCTIEHLPELIKAGIDSLKIEGRMKKPEYTAGVTAIYRKYIDKYYAGGDCSVAKEDMEALAGLYIRSDRQDGYYYRHNGRNMVTLASPSYSGCDDALLEEIRARYLRQRPRMEIKISAKFKVGAPAQLTLKVPEPANSGMTPLQVTAEGETVSAAVKQPITEENVRRQLGKLGDTVFSADKPELTLDENAFYPLKAINDLRRQAVHMLEELMVREQYRHIQNSHAQSDAADSSPRAEKAGWSRSRCGMFHALVRTECQLDALTQIVSDSGKLSRVYLEAGLVYKLEEKQELQSKLRGLADHRCELAIALPPVIRNSDEAYLEELWDIYVQNNDLIKGFLARSVDGLGFLTSMTSAASGTVEDSSSDQGRAALSPMMVYGDAGLYIWNRESLEALSAEEGEDSFAGLDGFCLPFELRASDQHRLLEGIGAKAQETAGSEAARKKMCCEKVVYGRIPLMITANCVFNTIDGCSGDREPEICFLEDRRGMRFPVLKNCRHCMNIIYNSLPLSLHAELSKWRGTVDFRLDFTIEDGEETAKILRYFTDGAWGERPFGAYTTGHEKRGAE